MIFYPKLLHPDWVELVPTIMREGAKLKNTYSARLVEVNQTDIVRCLNYSVHTPDLIVLNLSDATFLNLRTSRFDPIKSEWDFFNTVQSIYVIQHLKRYNISPFFLKEREVVENFRISYLEKTPIAINGVNEHIFEDYRPILKKIVQIASKKNPCIWLIIGENPSHNISTSITNSVEVTGKDLSQLPLLDGANYIFRAQSLGDSRFLEDDTFLDSGINYLLKKLRKPAIKWF